MPPTTTPDQRLARMMRDGARIVAMQYGQISIDVTPDVLALVDGVQSQGSNPREERNLFEPGVHGRDLPTRVHFL